MLSVLIPTYNYDITSLINQLDSQISKIGINYEIIVYDNGSKPEIINKNKSIGNLKNMKLIINDKSVGIAGSRKVLSDSASYDWLLLLDADTELKHDKFITNYINYIEGKYEAIFGGFSYKTIKPNKTEVLRWKYGIKCEAISAKIRNKNPYKITIAANVLIKKNVYQKLNVHTIGNAYGMDLYLGPQLKKNNISVLHIDNEVYHIGLENSEKYLQKVELAVVTLFKLYNDNLINSHENSLLKVFSKLKQYKFNKIFSFFYKILKNPIKRNLLSRNPSINLLQIYKLMYLCKYDLALKYYKKD